MNNPPSKKVIIVLATIDAIILAGLLYGCMRSLGEPRLTYPEWLSKFEEKCFEHGINSTVCAENAKIIEQYEKNVEPREAFFSLGCDHVAFQKFYLREVQRYIRAQGLDIPLDNKDMNEWIEHDFYYEAMRADEAAEKILEDDPYHALIDPSKRPVRRRDSIQ